MLMKYRDGNEAEDSLFDMLPASRRSYVARCLKGVDGPAPDQRLIDTLISIRRHEGVPSFYREVGRLLSPDFD